ncbi:MAG: hypothetical protein EZS28_038475 [Streblomastix strix]|uniref:Uncharacterized protein n=1 Tax=Streblomastix strix TaxID=222440 RepID=A0A5J4U6Q1_9EUKA|nr:MAG: hypothetical protein EZS28_038475 [Streblomastix strix]
MSLISPLCGDNVCTSPFGASFFLFYYETLPLGPLPSDPLLVYGVGHQKQKRKAIKSTGIIAKVKSLKLKSQRQKVKTNSESLVIDRSAGKEVVVKNNKLKLKQKLIKALCYSQLCLMLPIGPLSSQIISCVSYFRLDMACLSSSATVLSSTLVLSIEILQRTRGVM